jgi:hypothetical protein
MFVEITIPKKKKLRRSEISEEKSNKLEDRIQKPEFRSRNKNQNSKINFSREQSGLSHFQMGTQLR